MSQTNQFQSAYRAGYEKVRGNRWFVFVVFAATGLGNAVRYYSKDDTICMFLYPTIFISAGVVSLGWSKLPTN
jgi:hypothetical protein